MINAWPILLLLAAADPRPGPVEIKADRLEILGKKRQAVWTGNVRAQRGDATLRCERMVAHYNADHDITRIECSGFAEVVEGDKWARGERADFDNLTGTIEVTGSPEARQGTNHLRGSRVVIQLGKDQIRVDNARSVFDAPKRRGTP